MSRYRVALVLAATAAIGACGHSTRLVESWKDPTVQSFPLNRTLAVFMTTDAATRRIVEDRLAARLPGGVASYRVIPDDQISNPEAVKAAVSSNGFDGAVIMRLVSVTTEVTVHPDFYGYWGYWRNAYDPATYSTERIYSVESTLHSLRDGKMVWMGRTETIDPKNTKKLADKSVKAALENLARAGYLP